MFALADCNNFYASCERLFRPELNGVPIVILSNNDGCVIARSQEAKDLGIKMGAVFHKIQDEIRHFNVKCFSSNYEMYGDISARVMQNLARFTPDVEVYSIDECFLGLSGFKDLPAYARKIRETAVRNTGIPISVGVGPTKVLAKVANKLAKKAGGVKVLETSAEITTALDTFPIGDVWGIGGQTARKLHAGGLTTAGQFRQLPIDWVQKKFTVTGARIWRELHGESCIPMKFELDPKQAMCTSRGFGKLTSDFKELKEATASYAARLSAKLRKNKLCATVLNIRLLTNGFRPDLPQFFPSISMPLSHPANNVLDIVSAAQYGLTQIYVPDILFIKVEVMVTGLIPENEVQMNIFQAWQGEKRNKASAAMDALNERYGRDTVNVASENVRRQAWAMKRQFLSPQYTTNWQHIPDVS